MSRIGNRKLVIPAGVTATINDGVITVKGPKGELTQKIDSEIEVKITETGIETVQRKESKRANTCQGTMNSLISNMIEGVSKGYEKGLEAVGVGYRFQVSGNKITVNAGYSNPKVIVVPAGLTAEAVSTTEITIKGIDKQKVNEFAAKVREIREPEPYKGKGIKYADEVIIRKAGKAGKK